MFLFSRSSSVLGIDIGTSYIKAVQLKKDSEKPVIESYGMVNVIYPTTAAIKIDVIEQSAGVIKELYKKARFSTKQVAVSIPANVAFVTILSLPAMSEKEMQKAVEYQARKFIPLPLSDVSLGWQILEEGLLSKGKENEGKVTGGEKSEKILLTAVPQNVVNNYLKVFELAGLELKALEIESLSLIRSLVSAEDRNGILIVDIGARSTILNLVYHGYLWSSRHLSLGGDTITTSISNSMGVSFERAEQLKKSSSDYEADSPVGQIVKNIANVIKTEIQQVMRIAENQGKKITRILLTGGGSKLQAFKTELGDLAVKVELGNSLQYVDYRPVLHDKLLELEPQLAVSVGLALRGGKK